MATAERPTVGVCNPGRRRGMIILMVTFLLGVLIAAGFVWLVAALWRSHGWMVSTAAFIVLALSLRVLVRLRLMGEPRAARAMERFIRRFPVFLPLA